MLRQGISTSSPVHARQVPPEVSSTVSRRDLDGIDHHRVTLQQEGQYMQS